MNGHAEGSLENISQQAAEVADIIEDLIIRRAAGEQIDDQDVIAAHPNLAKELAEDLAALAKVEQARRLAEGSTVAAPSRTVTQRRQAGESSQIGLDSFLGYRVLGEIHRGGQGVVYKATQLSTKRKVAIKVLLHGMFASKSAKRRFEREIELVAQLSHPNIISIFHSGVTETGLQFYVMDYVRGQMLDAWVRRRKPTLEVFLRLFLTISEAVQFAHQRGVIHRDLKPSNILVGASDSPKVLDFGLAKLLAGPVETVVSASRDLIGTLPYMAPEQVCGGHETVDTRTDVYALGVILYEMLTGQHPYPVHGSMAEVIKNITESPPAPLVRSGTLAPDARVHFASRFRRSRLSIDEDVQTIALKALAKEPDRRYQSAGELARDIQRFLSDEPIEARRDSNWYLLRKTVKRYKAQAAVAAGIAIVVSIACIVSFTLWRTAAGERDRARSAERRSEQVTEFLQDMIGFADPNEARTPNLTMRDALDRAAAMVQAGFHDDPIVEADIRRTIGRAYLHLGALQRAKPQLLEALRVRNELHGNEHPSVAQSQADLAFLYQGLGDYTEAVRWCNLALDARRAQSGSEHEDVAESLTQLGELHRLQGDYKSAATLLNQAVNLLTNRVGSEDPRTLSALAALANLVRDEGDYERAEKHLRDILKTRRSTLGADHPHTISALHSLARIMSIQGRDEEAERLYRLTIDTGRRVLGDNHPALLRPLGGLAALQRKLGNYEESERVLRQCIELQRRVLGDDHPDTLSSLWNLASTVERLGRYRESEILLRKVLESRQRGAGRDHPATVQAMRQLAFVLYKQGKDSEADLVSHEAVDASRAALGPEHPWTLNAMHILGCVLEARESPAAEIVFRELSKMRIRIHGEGHTTVLWSQLHLSTVLGYQGKLDEAEQTARDVLAEFQRHFGVEHRSTLWAMNTLGEILAVEGKYAEAENVQRRAVDIGGRILEQDHPDRLRWIDNLVEVLVARKKFAEAKPLAEQLVASRRNAAEQEGATPAQLNEYANLLLNVGLPELREPQTALSFAKKAVELTKSHEFVFLYTLARAYSASTNTDAAIQTLERALPLIPPGPSRLKSQIECHLVESYEVAGNLVAAEQRCRSALARRRNDESLPVELADALADLGRVLVKLDRHAEAEPFLRECTEIASASVNDPQLFSDASSLLGIALMGQERFSEAEPFLLNASERISNTERDHSSCSEIILDRVVRLYNKWGKTDMADKYREIRNDFAGSLDPTYQIHACRRQRRFTPSR